MVGVTAPVYAQSADAAASEARWTERARQTDRELPPFATTIWSSAEAEAAQDRETEESGKEASPDRKAEGKAKGCEEQGTIAESSKGAKAEKIHTDAGIFGGG